MTVTNKILGQANVAANTDTTLYTVPASTNTNVTLHVTNVGVTTFTYRVALVLSGDTLGLKHYVAYEAAAPVGSIIQFTALTLNAGDQIVVRANGTGMSFTACGIEFT